MISSVENAGNRFDSCFLTKESVIEKHNVTAGIMSLPSPDIARNSRKGYVTRCWRTSLFNRRILSKVYKGEGLDLEFRGA